MFRTNDRSYDHNGLPILRDVGIKLIDFGFASKLSDTRCLFHATPEYAATEQFLGMKRFFYKIFMRFIINMWKI
jgi:serine/threonine protein kinase